MVRAHDDEGRSGTGRDDPKHEQHPYEMPPAHRLAHEKKERNYHVDSKLVGQCPQMFGEWHSVETSEPAEKIVAEDGNPKHTACLGLPSAEDHEHRDRKGDHQGIQSQQPPDI